MYSILLFQIDEEVVMVMSDEDLATYIPKHGDRLAVFAHVRQFANQSKKEKKTLFKHIKNKVTNKLVTNELPARETRSLSQRGNQNARRNARAIDIGWLHRDTKYSYLKQVRAHSGGGTRTVNIPRDNTMESILSQAKELFFPSGVSKKGKAESFQFSVADNTYAPLDFETKLQDLLDKTKLKTVRLYMVTCSVKRDRIADDSSDEDDKLPDLFTPGMTQTARPAAVLRIPGSEKRTTSSATMSDNSNFGTVSSTLVPPVSNREERKTISAAASSIPSLGQKKNQQAVPQFRLFLI